MLQRRYVHGSGAGDDPQVWFEGSVVADTARRNLYTDERGSIVAVTDSAGAVLNLNTYDEYGNPGAANTGAFQYTGQVWLPELGMYYYKARMYSPILGRFMQTDPIGYGDGMNMYSYVHNDPASFVDPSGLADDKCSMERSAPSTVTPQENDPGIDITVQVTGFGHRTCSNSKPTGGVGGRDTGSNRHGGGGGGGNGNGGGSQENQQDSKYREYLDKCVQDKVGALGWALDGLTSLAGLDTDIQGTLTENYGDFVDFAAVGLPVGQWLAQPRVRAGTAAGRMIQGEVSGARAGGFIGRALGGRAGMVPLMRAGRVVGGVASRALAVPAAFVGGYVAGAVASCSIEYAVGSD